MSHSSFSDSFLIITRVVQSSTVQYTIGVCVCVFVFDSFLCVLICKIYTDLIIFIARMINIFKYGWEMKRDR